jgi:hypothetical protein
MYDVTNKFSVERARTYHHKILQTRGLSSTSLSAAQQQQQQEQQQ